MTKRVLTTPLRDADIEDLRIGDVFYITGVIVTGRDDVHHRVVDEGMECPVDLRGGVIFHAGPIIRETPERNELISIGPTSSVRMDAYAAKFLPMTGVKVMIGKGGMNDATAAACREHKAIHCIFPGGCAVAATEQVEKIDGVFWRELGMPECLWVLKVREFGPLVVTIDTRGDNMFAENRALYAANKDAAMAPIIESVRDFQKVE